MKIFKNRGDIYLSKSRTGADREQHILLGILAAVLLVPRRSCLGLAEKPIICWRLPAKIIKICMRLC